MTSHKLREDLGTEGSTKHLGYQYLDKSYKAWIYRSENTHHRGKYHCMADLLFD